MENPIETEFLLGKSSINGGLSTAVFDCRRVDQPKIEESMGASTDCFINKIVSVDVD